MKRRLGLLRLPGLLLGLAAAMAGCLSTPAKMTGEAAVRLLGGSLHCARQVPKPAVQAAGDEAAYARLLAALNLKPTSGPDFSREIAVLVALGRRPTLGYRLEPATDRARVVNGLAIMPVIVRAPPADALVGQAVSSPCLVLGLERAGLSALRVEDQNGSILGQVPLE